MYRFTPIEIAAGTMIEAAMPCQYTPPKVERLEVAATACQQLANLAIESLNCRKGCYPGHEVIVPLGIYGTREAVFSLIDQNGVDAGVASKVASEVSDIASTIQRRFPVKRGTPQHLGSYAELGMLNMVWEGIVDGELGVDYAFLLGKHGHEKDHSGLRGDIDLAVHKLPPPQKRSGRRANVQVKASAKREVAVYDEGIAVVTAQGLFDDCSSNDAVSKLLRWPEIDEDTKRTAYQRFSAKIAKV